MRKKLIQLRKSRGVTQYEVAKTLGISRSFYGHIEKGLRNPTYGLAKRIAEIFGVKIEDIFLDQESFRLKQDINNISQPTGTEGK